MKWLCGGLIKQTDVHNASLLCLWDVLSERNVPQLAIISIERLVEEFVA